MESKEKVRCILHLISDFSLAQCSHGCFCRNLHIKLADDKGPRIKCKPKQFKDAIKNTFNIQPEQLPLDLLPFKKVPVLLYGRHGELGNLDTLAGSIWLGS